MITYESIKDAQETITKYWPNNGTKVIETCARMNPFNSTFTEFLKHCTPCGGNWGGMLLTGLRQPRLR